MKEIVFGLSLALGLFSVANAAPTAGDRILARWPADGLWYPAKVQSVKADGVNVSYDDGDLALVKTADIKKVDWQVGSKLECNWHNKGKYFPGKIATMQAEIIEFHYDDGDAEQMTISRCRSR
jgi:Lamin-B receptor of TUDOR domain